MMRAAAFVLAAVVWTASAATATAQDTAPAYATVEAYMAATEAQDWRGVAERVDPDDLDKMLPFVQMFGEMALRDDAEELAPPPDDAVGAFAWLMVTMTEQAPMIADMMGGLSGELLGAVAETDSLVHVVMRSTTDMMGTPVSEVSAVSVRLRPDGRWMVKLSGQVDALAGVTEMLGAFQDSGDEVYEDEILDEVRPSGKRPPKPGRDG